MEWFGNLLRVFFDEPPVNDDSHNLASDRLTPGSSDENLDNTRETLEQASLCSSEENIPDSFNNKIPNVERSNFEVVARDSPNHIFSRADDLCTTTSESRLLNEESPYEEHVERNHRHEENSVVDLTGDCTAENMKGEEQSQNSQLIAVKSSSTGKTEDVSTLLHGLKLESKSDSVSMGENSHDNCMKKTAYSLLLENLKLDPEEKFTVEKALTVDSITLRDEALTSPGDIPNYILRKLMIVDYHARAFKLDQCMQNSIDVEESSDEDDHNQNEDEDKDDRGSVNPMDAFLALFHCCDDFLRQDLTIKLSSCQLSVPFLLPHPDEPSEKVTMLLWALDGIKKSWKAIDDGKQSFSDHHAFVMEHPFPVVSFIRVGKNGISKSRVLNEVISDLNGHRDFFFHKDCRGGGVERKIVNGLVEICWYLPGGREQQAFEREICFANLRGDARMFSKQVNILVKISSILFILLPSEIPDTSTQEFVTEATRSEGKVVLVFNEKRPKKTKQFFDSLSTWNQAKLASVTRASQKNEDDFVVTIRSKIKSHIEDTSLVPLKNLGTLASDNNIPVDKYDHKTNSVWHENVSKWLENGPKEAKMMLKVQSNVSEIAKLERENFRWTRKSNKSEEEYSNEIYDKINAARECQKQSLKKMDQHVRNCLNYIPLMNKTEREYSLTVLKHDLNNMSLDVLAPLQADYRKAWNETLANKKRRRYHEENEEKESFCEKRLKELEKSMEESSFGLEHIFREMAQIFQLTDINIHNYAAAAAHILLSGRPLELMDGDSSYVPLKWFNAVFEELKTVTKNAKIFVTSVLGIQSSGKSTMLNTMFGLQFPVSAGRCTRGAFASLIPLSDSLRRKSRYEYILIIDTEGLRGSADPMLRQHDNELATFAIGVADLTIVNIFGENYNEMKEFLEIAVHAFLKMKLVNEKRMCKIVHQNVAAIDASNELATERMSLREKLDRMTKIAATEENCETEFEELNDVLAFNENEDVFYIPSLLQGSPPMAPVNPEYGKATQKVKENIIEIMCSPADRLPVTISQFQRRVNDLWNAILRENFIFTFRNTIEVRAYTSLDQKFFEESVKTMVTRMAELEQTVSVSLMRSPGDHRENIWEVQKLQILETAEELSKKMESKMEDFFETNEDKTTLEQWKESTMIKITQLKENQVHEVTKNCKTVFDHLQSRQEIDKMKLVYKTKLLENAKKFITSVGKSADIDVDNCETIFEEEWSNWINAVPANNVKKANVAGDMVFILCNANIRKFKDRFREKCREKNFDITKFGNSLPSIEAGNIQSVTWKLKFKNLFFDDPHLVHDARIITERAIHSAIDFAKQTQRSGGRCTKSCLQQLYQITSDSLKRQTEKQPFKFRDETIADVLLCSFGKTYPIFQEMEDKYHREHDIKLDLETNLKPDLKNYFLNQCKKMRKEVLAAHSFVDVIKRPIQLDINQSMGTAVAKELLKRSEFQSKGQFHANVLVELGEQKLFSAYVPYLRNPVAFLKEKLQDSILKYCIITEKPSVVSILKNQIESKKGAILNVILNASRQISVDGNGINDWLNYFMDNCSTLAVTRDMFFVVTIDEDLKDFEIFENQVETMLDDVYQEILDRGVDLLVLQEWQPQPFDKLVDLMFGCDKCCPFCKALCDQTLRDHDCQHSTRNHRPQGITGYHYEGSKVLDTTICTTSVANDYEKFKNVDTSQEWHRYKEYQTVNDYYKSWSIAPDSSFEASSYWKWFMATYSNELSEHYETKKPKIPSNWKNISFGEAKSQILEQYNLA